MLTHDPQATIIPILVADFDSPADIGWYGSAYFLPLTVLMPLFGKSYSLWRVKWLYLFALAIITGMLYPTFSWKPVKAIKLDP